MIYIYAGYIGIEYRIRFLSPRIQHVAPRNPSDGSAGKGGYGRQRSRRGICQSRHGARCRPRAARVSSGERTGGETGRCREARSVARYRRACSGCVQRCQPTNPRAARVSSAERTDGEIGDTGRCREARYRRASSRCVLGGDDCLSPRGTSPHQDSTSTAPSGAPPPAQPPPPPQTRGTQSHSAPTPPKRPMLTPEGEPRPSQRLGTWTLVRPQKGNSLG